jgi:hypothetical protein
LKLRFQDFTTLSRRSTRQGPYRSSAEAYKDALALLDRTWDGKSAVRLLGLGFAELEDSGTPNQGELFAEAEEKTRKAENAVFEIERSGKGKVTKARLLGREDTRGRPKPEA